LAVHIAALALSAGRDRGYNRRNQPVVFTRSFRTNIVMLLRAGLIYVLTVALVMLAGGAAFEHFQRKIAQRELSQAEKIADDLRNEIRTVTAEKSDAERLVRLSDQASAEEIKKRETAEMQVRQLRQQLDALLAGSHFAESARKASEATRDLKSKGPTDAELAAARQESDAAQQTAAAAQKQADELRAKIVELQAQLAIAQERALVQSQKEAPAAQVPSARAPETTSAIDAAPAPAAPPAPAPAEMTPAPAPVTAKPASTPNANSAPYKTTHKAASKPLSAKPAAKKRSNWSATVDTTTDQVNGAAGAASEDQSAKHDAKPKRQPAGKSDPDASGPFLPF
jgi:hypothetical protein